MKLIIPFLFLGCLNSQSPLRSFKSPDLCDASVQQYSGHISVTDTEKIFFWLLESRNNPLTDPIVLWLNGGPGASSMIGAFSGVGPCHFPGPLLNRNSWNTNATLLFVDQPFGTGFSGGSNNRINNASLAMDHMVTFLTKFYARFPSYRRLDIHLFGESHAGIFIPNLAAKILKRNKQQTPIQAINLRSIGMGSPLLDIVDQYASYPTMACKILSPLRIKEQECQKMIEKAEKCVRLLNYTKSRIGYPDYHYPFSIRFCDKHLLYLIHDASSVYDIRLDRNSSMTSHNTNIHLIEHYLNQADVQSKLLPRSMQFTALNSGIAKYFYESGDIFRSSKEDLAYILNSGLPVLVYVGEMDFLCNWVSALISLGGIKWEGAEEFIRESDHYLNQYRKPILPVLSEHHFISRKEITSVRGLTFVKVTEASHSATLDQPKFMNELVTSWIHNPPRL